MAPTLTDVRTRGRDILGEFNARAGRNGDSMEKIARDAREAIWSRGALDPKEPMSLTQWLERQDPTEDYPVGDPLSLMDAFDRQMYWAGIRSHSDAVKGLYASPVERFYASDQPASIVLFPEFINRTMREQALAPDILSFLIGQTTAINSNTYRTSYVVDDVTKRRMSRVTQGGEIPRVKITEAEHVLTLKKYGVALEGTYEVYRRMQLDLFQRHLRRIAQQAMLDKSQDALDVAINGDGNSNAALNYNLTALDPSTTAGNLTYKAWLKWGMQPYPYKIDTVIAGTNEIMDVLTIQYPNLDPIKLLALLSEATGDANGAIKLATPVWGDVQLIYFPLAPANLLIGLTRGDALEMITEIGSNITETDKVILNQTQTMTITENVAFGKLLQIATTTLTLNA